jgi:hypothetical protein
MAKEGGWVAIEREAREAFVGKGRFPIAAYSELMPPPYVGLKPFDPRLASASCTSGVRDETCLDIDEYEQAHELTPGLSRIASHLLNTLKKLVSGGVGELPRTLLTDNRAWPERLAAAAREGRHPLDPFTIVVPLALSRTQDDQGNVRWTLFGSSHEPAASVFWNSFGDGDGERFDRLVVWALGGAPHRDALRVFAREQKLPAFARSLALSDGEADPRMRVLLTLEPFGTLPEAVQRAFLDGTLQIVPTPSSLVFSEHPRYKKLAAALPRASQIGLLHVFLRVEGGYTIRIPQSGWLDEHDPSQPRPAGSHRAVPRVVRTHRWQRTARDEVRIGDGAFTDPVTVALFSTNPDDLGLYGKPMAKNVQIWTQDYELILDGPRAHRDELERASDLLDRGGRYGYRFYFPPMRAGTRELFWHLPLVARFSPDGSTSELYADEPPLGYVTAERADAPSLRLAPKLLRRPGHTEAAWRMARDPGQVRHTTAHNVRKLLEFAELMGAPLAPSFARALVRASKETTLDAWLAKVSEIETLSSCLGPEPSLGEPITLDATRTRGFEEKLWRTIASLAEGSFRAKDNADRVLVNEGKTGGPAARAAGIVPAATRDLERLGDALHVMHNGVIGQCGMTGRASVLDHRFSWKTEVDLDWSEGWTKNQAGGAHERNIVVVIPGRRRDEAVIMADHYDTAYMEDVYDEDRGGDGLRAAAAGADDNHSATTALLLAAETLLPLAREGKLERDVWLVHLTGEEFPSDCLGARALAAALVERNLELTGEDGSAHDVSHVRVVGAYVLDMIAHNTSRDRDVFQIASGEGRGSARLAHAAHVANERWNLCLPDWNAAPDRKGLGRAIRKDGADPPPPFAHLRVSGEIRVEWEPRSSLYNTDGQIFSDVGIPVVLFMENYDISRTGYHDTHDTMKNIDLDYAAAVTAIAIEAVASVACAP